MNDRTELPSLPPARIAPVRAMSRRSFLLSLGALSGGAALLAACGATNDVPTTTSAASVAPVATTAASAATATTAATASTAASGATTSGAAATASRAAASPTAAGTAQDTTTRIVAATNAFLATLDSTQKASVQFEWGNTTQKQRWSNLPEGLYTRAGLRWGTLSAASQNAWLAVMQATLSTEGYNRVMAEWNADDALAAAQGSSGGTPTTGGTSTTPAASSSPGGAPPTGGTRPAGGGTGGGGGLLFGKQYYWVALIGPPSATSAWQWQWGGHHVTINATIVGANISLTPSFIGAQPATYTDASGKTIRPLGDIEDEAFALITSLDATQQQAAVLGGTGIDLVLGPGQDGKTIQAEGLPASQLNASQQTALLKLIGHYSSLANDTYATARNAEILSGLSQTYLAWYGPTTKGSAAYFRVAGPTVVIEYSPQGGGGTGTGLGGSLSTDHIHGIYRDPTNDYGVKYTK